MRPLSGGDGLPSAKPRSRKSSVADNAAVHSGPSGHAPTTFFLRSEEEMERSLVASKSIEPAGRPRDSAYGVQSLEDTLEAAFGRESRAADSKSDHVRSKASSEKSSPGRPSRNAQDACRRDVESSKSSPARSHKRKASVHSTSNPLTPLNAESCSPVPASAMPSTPRSVSLQSLKLSDEEPGLDDGASQAVASSGEEEEDTMQGESSSFPQLVMPSIQMPSRRPFTAKGKAMGKLKVLVAGQAGTGKTSLIRSTVQLCEHIVHVDPLSPSQSVSQPLPPKSTSRKRKAESLGTTRITEIHASTKSYPPWWTDMEESRVLRRRKSTADAVLERNICFVDTPGVGSGPSKAEDMGRIVDYVESLLYQTASATTMDDSDLVGVISGSGGISVDVIIYLLPPSHDISKDIEFMQRLSALTNVIPVIAKSDTLSATELVAVKTSILARLQATSIRPFLFGVALDDALLALQGLPVDQSPTSADPSGPGETKSFPSTVPTHPYAISSTTGPDNDTMDASLLMSPDYVQPLLPSELTMLVSQVFDPESIAWLRHSAAKKFLAWRRRTKLPGDSFILHSLQQQQHLNRGSISSASVGLTGAALNASATSSVFSAASPSGVLVPRGGSPFYTSNPNFNSNLQSPFPASSPSLSNIHHEPLDHPTDFSLTRYAQGDQRLTEIRLAKWATDLQRSLRNERERYQELQRNERAKWLLERVGEEVASGNIVASPTTGSPRADWAVTKRGSGKEGGRLAHTSYGRINGKLDSRDPLGLCDFSDEVRRRGLVVVKILGGVSVLGAVMVAVVRACGYELAVPEGGIWAWLTGTTE